MPTTLPFQELVARKESRWGTLMANEGVGSVAV